jgi:hypothetical protein
VQGQIRRRERRAEPAGTRARATARGSGIDNSAVKAATALTIQRFMSSHLRTGSEPQIKASMERNGLPWRDGNNGRNSALEQKSTGLSEASVSAKKLTGQSRSAGATIDAEQHLVEVAFDKIAER